MTQPLNWQNGTVKSNGIQIHYTRTGGDKPPMVLNHGAMDDGLCWTRVAKALEDDYDLIMLDARGHGRSDSGQGDYSSQSRAADIAGSIQALGLDRPVVGGHSLGADASMHLGALYPQLTRGIFLEDPPVTLPGQPVFGGNFAEGKDPVKMMTVFMRLFRTLPKFLGRIAARKIMPGNPDDEINPWLDSKKRMSKDFMNSMIGALDFNAGIPEKLLGKIEIPVLLFIGDREKGSIVSMEVAESMKAATHDLRIVHLEGANHDIRRARFDDYIHHLRAFLNECYSLG